MNIPDALQSGLQAGMAYRHLKGRTENGVLVITLTIPQLLDDVVEEGLLQELLLVTTASEAGNVIVDLQQVKAASTAALKPLLGLHESIKQRSGRLLVCGLSPMVAEVFHLAELIRTEDKAPGPFEAAPDVDTALKLLARSPRA